MEKQLDSSALNENINEFDQEEWAKAYCNVEEELTNFELDLVKGSIPKEISGCFYRNGPGRLERDGQWLHHPFDGDGMIAAFRFNDGKVHLSNKFVRTKEWQEEEKAGRFLYRGVFGSQKKGGVLANAFDVRLKNIANTNVVRLGDDLLALWEAAGPHALNPETLETHGLSNLHGALKEGEAFSAHPRFDKTDKHNHKMVTFSVNTGPKSTIRLMEFGCDGINAGKIISDRKDSFPGFAFIHDFAITKNWAIFLQNAISFNPIPFLLGKKGAAQCLSSNPKEKGKFLLIPRDSGEFRGTNPRVIDGPEGFVFHHVNAWESEEEINIDSIYYKDFPSIEPNEDFRKINFDSIPEGILKRCKINLNQGSVKSDILSEQCCEFAMVNPNKQTLSAEYSWMAVAEKKRGNGPLQAIKKINLSSLEESFWSAAPKGFLSEPLMIPKTNSMKEDEGWIIALIWNGERSGTDLVLLSSDTLREEAILELPIKIPHGLHGSWIEQSK